MPGDGNERAARLARAFAHPMRIAILGALARKRTSPVRLAREMDARLSYLSYHFGVLRKLGFIRLARKLPKRGVTEHLYEAVPDAGRLSCRSVTLDAKGREEVTGILAEVEERISRVEARVAGRLAKAGGRGVPATIVLASLGPVAKAKKNRKSGSARSK